MCKSVKILSNFIIYIEARRFKHFFMQEGTFLISLYLFFIPMLHTLGMKYRYMYAKQWGIHCVSAQWFHDSVEAGYSMPEGDYAVDKEHGGAGEDGEGANGTSRKRYMYVYD